MWKVFTAAVWNVKRVSSNQVLLFKCTRFIIGKCRGLCNSRCFGGLLVQSFGCVLTQWHNLPRSGHFRKFPTPQPQVESSQHYNLKKHPEQVLLVWKCCQEKTPLKHSLGFQLRFEPYDLWSKRCADVWLCTAPCLVKTKDSISSNANSQPWRWRDNDLESRSVLIGSYNRILIQRQQNG